MRRKALPVTKKLPFLIKELNITGKRPINVQPLAHDWSDRYYALEEDYKSAPEEVKRAFILNTLCEATMRGSDNEFE